MNLFRSFQNKPFKFHLVDLDEPLFNLTTALICGQGGVVVNDENSIIKFTSPNRFNPVAYPRAKIYDIAFIFKCVQECKLVDPEDYRLSPREEEDEFIMMHFLHLCCVCTCRNDKTGVRDANINLALPMSTNIKTEVDDLSSEPDGDTEPLRPTPTVENLLQFPPLLAGGDALSGDERRNDFDSNEKRPCHAQYQQRLDQEMNMRAMESRRIAEAREAAEIARNRESSSSHRPRTGKNLKENLVELKKAIASMERGTKPLERSASNASHANTLMNSNSLKKCQESTQAEQNISNREVNISRSVKNPFFMRSTKAKLVNERERTNEQRVRRTKDVARERKLMEASNSTRSTKDPSNDRKSPIQRKRRRKTDTETSQMVSIKKKKSTSRDDYVPETSESEAESGTETFWLNAKIRGRDNDDHSKTKSKNQRQNLESPAESVERSSCEFTSSEDEDYDEIRRQERYQSYHERKNSDASHRGKNEKRSVETRTNRRVTSDSKLRRASEVNNRSNESTRSSKNKSWPFKRILISSSSSNSDGSFVNGEEQSDNPQPGPSKFSRESRRTEPEKKEKRNKKKESDNDDYVPITDDSSTEESVLAVPYESGKNKQNIQQKLNGTEKARLWRTKLAQSHSARKNPNAISVTRQPFTRSEQRIMLRFLIERNLISKAKGLTVWDAMLKENLLPHRTVQSVHNHFMKSILPYIKDRTDLTPRQIQEFRALQH